MLALSATSRPLRWGGHLVKRGASIGLFDARRLRSREITTPRHVWPCQGTQVSRWSHATCRSISALLTFDSSVNATGSRRPAVRRVKFRTTRRWNPLLTYVCRLTSQAVRSRHRFVHGTELEAPNSWSQSTQHPTDSGDSGI